MVSREDPFRFILRQDRALGLAGRGNDVSDFMAIFIADLAFAGRRRGFVEAAQVEAVAPQVLERPRRAVGILERRHARLVQNVLAFLHGGATHPARDDRLAIDRSVFLQRLGRRSGFRHRLRRQDHEQTVDARVLRHDLDRLCITLGPGVTQHIDGIAVAPGGGQQVVQRRDGVARKL